MLAQYWEDIGQAVRVDGLPLACAGAGLLVWGGWKGYPWLLPVVTVALLLSLLLRRLWYALRPDTLVDEENYQYPDEVYLPDDEETDLSAYFALGQSDTEEPQSQPEESAVFPGDADSPHPRATGWLSALLLLSITLLYCIGLPFVGFLAPTFLYLCALLWLLGETHGVVVAIASALVAAAVYLPLALLGVVV